MPFDWNHYLQLAQEILDEVDTANPKSLDDARLRCASSRAYYAAYWACRTYMEKRHRKNYGTSGAHTRIPAELQAMTWNPRAMQVGVNLSRIVPQRVNADYKPLAPFSHRNCQLLIIAADQIIQDMRTVP